MKLEYFVLDPSFFVSTKRLNNAFLILDGIFQNDAIVIKKPKVVLVSALRGINYVQERMQSKALQDVLVGWGLPKKNFSNL